MQDVVRVLAKAVPLVAMHVILVSRALVILPADRNTVAAGTADMVDQVLATTLLKAPRFMNTLLHFLAMNAAGTPTTDMHWVVTQGLQLVLVLTGNNAAVGVAVVEVPECTEQPR